MTRPNFFIVGAPKSGTTALSQYLGGHPSIFVSDPKEPAFWNEDHPWSRDIHGFRSVDEYLEIFADAEPEHLRVGEASTAYLQSKVSLARIAAFNSEAKIIIMLRNPIHAAYAMHGELVRQFREDCDDFEQAWNLQGERAGGGRLPADARVRHQLQYGEVASYAPQLRRAIDAIRPENLQIIVFDDFSDDTAGVYRQTLEHLGLEDDGRVDFPVVHGSVRFRSKFMGRLYMRPPAAFTSTIKAVRSAIKRQAPNVANFVVERVVSRPAERVPLSEEFVDELRDYFRRDIEETSTLLGRDLTHWLAP